MYEAMRQTLLRVNASLAGLLAEARRALCGECDFGVEDVRKIRGPVEEMAPIMGQSAELRRLRPELAGQFDLYKSQLSDMQTTLGQIRVMLLARQASLEAGRAQLSAVSQWMGAFRKTR
ncbi:MAG TPA: hypothetical protein VNY24_10905 [Candidatus Acidoferrales bacterium]|nr:hypothetical protein [Candidatus Acidoferrales bacterium]